MTKLNLPQMRMEQIVFVDCMNLDGSKNPHLFIDYHGNRYRVTIGDYKLTNEWGGMTLISAIAGIKTIIKTTKTLKQTTPPPGDSPTNIHKCSSRTHVPCVVGIMAPGKVMVWPQSQLGTA